MGTSKTGKLYVVALATDGKYYRTEPDVLLAVPGDRVAFQNLSDCKVTLLFPEEKNLFGQTTVPLDVGGRIVLDIPDQYVEHGIYPYSAYFHGSLMKASKAYEPAIIIHVEEDLG